MTTSTSPTVVRPATSADVVRICEICPRAYAETYRGLLPDEYIARTIRDFYNPGRVEGEVDPYSKLSGSNSPPKYIPVPELNSASAKPIAPA